MQLAAARRKRLPDVIGVDLDVVFCGINPGLYSTAIGHHFGRPGNRFWPALFAAGFTPRLFSPFDDHELLSLRLGVTNIASRTTAIADELAPVELRRGARSLRAKVLRHHPRTLAILGFTAYRVAFEAPDAVGGLQATHIGTTQIWLLPNPSGLNAHYSATALASCFRDLHRHVYLQG